jgi:hypothetical protein
LKDAHQIKVAMTNASLYAYVADGAGGLKVLQLTDPETMPNYAGFSPRPQPRLIASYKTKGEALAISKPLDRDRAADESGNQVSVFGRRGARPFNLLETARMMRTDGGVGQFFTVTDKPATKPLDFKISAVAKEPEDESSAAASPLQPGLRENSFAQLSALGLFMALAIVCKIRQKRLERS